MNTKAGRMQFFAFALVYAFMKLPADLLYTFAGGMWYILH